MVRKILLILISLLFITGCSKKEEIKEETGCDVEAQGCEIEVVTDEVRSYRTLIKNFTELSYDEAYSRITNGGSLVIYYGFETCPWCQELLPILNEFTEDYEIFYVNMKPDGEDSRVEGHSQYDSYLKNFELIKSFNESEKIIAPTIIEVINGELVMTHAGTVEGHNAKERKMTAEEKLILKETVSEFFRNLEVVK